MLDFQVSGDLVVGVVGQLRLSDYIIDVVKMVKTHQWSSGRIVPCHGTDPGSIPGWCRYPFFLLRRLFYIPFGEATVAVTSDEAGILWPVSFPYFEELQNPKSMWVPPPSPLLLHDKHFGFMSLFFSLLLRCIAPFSNNIRVSSSTLGCSHFHHSHSKWFLPRVQFVTLNWICINYSILKGLKEKKR